MHEITKENKERKQGKYQKQEKEFGCQRSAIAEIHKEEKNRTFSDFLLKRKKENRKEKGEKRRGNSNFTL